MEKEIRCYLGERLIFVGMVRVDKLDETNIGGDIVLCIDRKNEHIGTIACDRYEIKEG